jgi:dihydrofolate synthase/folylpolyglutamate synthase
MLDRGENHPTEFEIVTAIGMQYYMESECEAVVLEVGLGGRFDSTNVIEKPELAVITTISYDHMDILGDTLEKIAFEKAGIIKPGGDVLIYPQHPEAEKVIKQVCGERKAKLSSIDPDNIEEVSYGISGQVFNYKEYNGIRIALLGGHQAINAALAVEAAELLIKKGFEIKREDIYKGLENARWPGRMEVLQKDPVFIIDGAHNMEGAMTLSKNISKYFPGRKALYIMGVLKDKEYNGMIKAVMPNCRCVIAVTPDSPRALPAADLAEAVRVYCKEVYISDTIKEAVEKSLELASDNEIICAFGSLYYIGKVRDAFGL